MIDFDADKSMTKHLGLIILMALALSGCAGPESVISATVPKRISWTPPTHNTDGSSFDDLSKYRLYYGPDQGSLGALLDIDSEGVAITSYVFSTVELETLAILFSSNSTHVFALTAISSRNIESDISNLYEFL